MRAVRNSILFSWIAAGALASCCGCSSAPYATQRYAKLSNAKVFEEDFKAVWKALLSALSEFKLEEEDAEKGRVRTDWIYSTSNDKFIEYAVNGFPRKHYLQTRYKYEVAAEKQIGGVKITIRSEEEVEQLRPDGAFESWYAVSDTDTNRAHELLSQVENKLLSKPNL